jgi:hypothetical protein
VFLHEGAHALFDQLRIPILGREKDAADQFVAFILILGSASTTHCAWLTARRRACSTI